MKPTPPTLSLFAVLGLACAAPAAHVVPVPSARVPTPAGPPAPPAASASASSAPAGGPTLSLPPELAALRDAGLASRRAAAIVQSLTSEVGPRLAGSPGDAAAVAWALRTMRAIGLANVRAEPVKVPHWERGAESGETLGPVPHALALTALGGSIGTPAGGVVAEVFEVATVADLDAADPGKVAGKLVYIDHRMRRTADGSGYGAAVGARSSGWIRASKLGAVGLLIRSIGTDDNRLPHTGNMRKDASTRPIPAAALSAPDADRLHLQLAGGAKVRAHVTLGCRWLPDADSANVVGELPGAVPAGEVVLLGAHLDAWDLGDGAIDDGAGVGAVLEAARLLGAAGSGASPPRRTLRVVLFANEENGLMGGRAYAKAHEAELGKHVVALEADSGTKRVLAARFVGGTDHREAFRAVAGPLAALGVSIDDGDSEGGADLLPIRAQGVPGVSLWQDATTYFDVHHTANDTFDKIDAEALAQVATSFAFVAHGALRLGGDFGRVPMDKRETKF